MSVSLNPNPNECTLSIGGASSQSLRAGDVLRPAYELKTYKRVDTPMPHWEFNQTTNEVSTLIVKEGVNFERWGCCLSGISTDPVDGTILFTSIYPVKAWDGSNIRGIQFDDNVFNLPAENVTAYTDAEGHTTTQTGTVNGYRFGSSSFGWNKIKAELTINPGCPVFLTEAELDAYLRTGEGEPINTPEPIELNTYDYYIYNMISTTPGSGAEYEYFYRYKTVTNGRLAFYKNKIIGQPQYDRTLVGVENINQIYKGSSPDEDPFPMASSTVLNFLGNAVKYDDGNAFYPIMYQTNIPTFDTKEHADAYILTGDETGIIDKWRSEEVVPGEIGEPTDTTEQGENGMVLSYGGGAYRLSNSEMAAFFNEVFDPASLEDILNGTKLFGSNQIGAINDIIYFPLNIDDVATLSADSDIYLGAYEIQNTKGDRVLKNNKVINMGTHFFAPPYGVGDHRNYEPVCKIYVLLPYAGLHELQISKYLNKNITLKLAVDVLTGQATYYVFSNQTIMDSFDCIIGAHRPVTAVDQSRHMAAATQAISGAAVQTIGTTVNAVTGGATAGNLAGTAANATSAILSAYNAMNVLNDAPMTQRGGHAGAVALFDVKSPYFIFAQMQPVAPSNLVRVKGKPSASGGKLSSFFGYFEAAAVDLPTFSGTQAEAEELMQILKGGIYID